jgi:hypothetical protein
LSKLIFFIVCLKLVSYLFNIIFLQFFYLFNNLIYLFFSIYIILIYIMKLFLRLHKISLALCNLIFRFKNLFINFLNFLINPKNLLLKQAIDFILKLDKLCFNLMQPLIPNDQIIFQIFQILSKPLTLSKHSIYPLLIRSNLLLHFRQISNQSILNLQHILFIFLQNL